MANEHENSKNDETNEPLDIEVILPEDKESQTSDESTELGFRINQKTLWIGFWAIILIVGLLGIWGIGSLIVHATAEPLEPTAIPTSTFVPTPENLAAPNFTTENEQDGVVREPEVQTTVAAVTTIEEEDRTDYEIYIVQEGDTIFDIADRYGLAAETILWTNWYVLGEMPDAIYPGNEVIIPPTNGAMYQWYDGDGLNGVSSYFSVTPEDIINYPLNNLDPNTIGDWSHPNIEAGTFLFVPGGTRPNVSWVPARGEEISGNAYLGPGACSG
ncbi:MAG: LysM peptidoglycan-binding domain-containing protein, partial [Anaerolineaceae bacterium]|nr:LysM peptidoglycan-binding domain-containing protein [Anaerolineaceae bacterium]